MDIQCPSCQRKLAIGDQYAGQLVKCPACNGVFSAPSLAPPPAPPAPPANLPGTIPFSGDAVRPPDVYSTPPPPAPPSSPPPAIFDDKPASSPGNFSTTHTVELRPDILRWVAPVAISLIVLLSFFPWISDFRETPPTADQIEAHMKAVQKAHEENLPQPRPLTSTPGFEGSNLWQIAFGERGSGLWIIYLLFTLFLAVPLTWVKLLIEMNIIPKLDFLKPFWDWRSAAVGGFLAFILLFALLAWFSLAPGQVTSMGLYLGLKAHIVAIIAYGLEHWLILRRKTSLPIPELTVKW